MLTLNINHKIAMRGELARYGYHGLVHLTMDDLRYLLSRCTRWGAVALFRPRKAYAPRRIPGPGWRAIPRVEHPKIIFLPYQEGPLC
jgi:hypothetical protein